MPALISLFLIVLAAVFGLFIYKTAADSVSQARASERLHAGWTLDDQNRN